MAKKKSSRPTDEEPRDLYLSIDWGDGSGPGGYANHLLVQEGEHEFYLSFYDLRPPTTLGEDPKDAYERLKGSKIRPQCVGRIVIAKDRLEDFAEAINSTIEKSKRKREKKDAKAEIQDRNGAGDGE